MRQVAFVLVKKELEHLLPQQIPGIVDKQPVFVRTALSSNAVNDISFITPVLLGGFWFLLNYIGRRLF